MNDDCQHEWSLWEEDPHQGHLFLRQCNLCGLVEAGNIEDVARSFGFVPGGEAAR